MSTLDYFRRLIFVHKCVGCGKLQSYEKYYDALCADCKRAVEKQKTESCPECARSAWACTCQPTLMSKAGAFCLSKLYFYHPEKDQEPQNEIIYFIKRNRNRRAFDFLGEELYTLIKRELSVLEISGQDCVIVSIPRSKKAYLTYGIDQAQELGMAVSRVSGIGYLRYFRRSYVGKEQKKLNSAERKKNMKNSLLPNVRFDRELEGKYVVLIDDIVTTGAGMAACIDILRKKKIKGVFCCAISADFKKRSTR